MPGTGPIDRQPGRNLLTDGIREFKDARKLVDGGGLAAGDDEAVDVVELCRAPDADAGGTGRFDGVDVLTEIALQGQDADPQARTHA